MAEDLTTARVWELPNCDFHPNRQAKYDGKTRQGPWAHMCRDCFISYGVGLGLGKGQELFAEKQSTQPTSPTPTSPYNPQGHNSLLD